MQIQQIKAGLFGQPVAKSLSPEIFRIFSGLTGARISYEARETPASSLAAEIAAARAEGWAGFNVTIPHKAAVCAMLAIADPAARAAGAVNTVRFGKTGLEGLNTDARAILRSFEERGAAVSGKNAAVFGSGGGAAAAGWALGRAGAASAAFHSRNPEAAARLALKLAGCFPKTFFSAAPFAAPGKDFSIFINATPLGMYAPGSPPCEPAPGSLCLDLAYAQGGAGFTKTAAACGADIIDGLEILVWQAVLSLKYWTGLPGGDIVEFNREAIRLFREKLKRGN